MTSIPIQNIHMCMNIIPNSVCSYDHNLNPVGMHLSRFSHIQISLLWHITHFVHAHSSLIGRDIYKWQCWLYLHPFASHLYHVSPIWLCDMLGHLVLFPGFNLSMLCVLLPSFVSRTLVYDTILSCIYDLIMNTLSTWSICANVDCFSYLIVWHALPSNYVLGVHLSMYMCIIT